MNCKKIKKILLLYVDNMASAEEKEALAVHIKECAQCKAVLGEYENTWKLLDAEEPIEPRPDYVSRFWTALAKEETWQKRLLDGVRSLVLTRRAAYGCVVALVLFMGIHTSRLYYMDITQTRSLLINMSEEELEMIDNFELIANLDFFENIEDLGA